MTPQEPRGEEGLTRELHYLDALMVAGGIAHNAAAVARSGKNLELLPDALTRLAAVLDDGLNGRPSPPPPVVGWRPIEEHDNSRNPVVIEDKHGRPVVAWRNHPSSRTDNYLSIPGDWVMPYPKRFIPLPAAPLTTDGVG